ncbi:MAG TPA: phosphoadenylyl-sulfate reductase [Myxococcales bacterium]|nr:phosphoadenylyl-sulfate reductase [Myxococcales bacterium]
MSEAKTLLTEAELAVVQSELSGAPAEVVLAWADRRFGSQAAVATSFGAEDVVLIDLAFRHAPRLRVFTLDTGRLPPETYDVMEAVRVRYGIPIETYFPERAAVEKLERDKGYFSFRLGVAERKECCGLRKVEPLGRALRGRPAWVTGLRREQAVTRTALQTVELDAANGGIVKLNPLAAWSEAQVWDYIRAQELPYNALHDRGYPSIGCAPCTRAVAKGEDVRAGRWWWEEPEHKECGLHGRTRPAAVAEGRK